MTPRIRRGSSIASEFGTRSAPSVLAGMAPATGADAQFLKLGRRQPLPLEIAADPEQRPIPALAHQRHGLGDRLEERRLIGNGQRLAAAKTISSSLSDSANGRLAGTAHSPLW